MPNKSNMKDQKNLNKTSLQNIGYRIDEIFSSSNGNNNSNYFDPTNLKIILQDEQMKDKLLRDKEFRDYLMTNTTLLAQLWLETECRQQLEKEPKIIELVRKEEFQNKLIIEKVKTTIPLYDLLVYTILEPSLIDVIERDHELLQAILDDTSLSALIRSDPEYESRILSNPFSIIQILRDPVVQKKLLLLPETVCRLDRVKKGEKLPNFSLPSLAYSQEEINLFELDIKRAVFTLGCNMDSLKKKLRKVDQEKETIADGELSQTDLFFRQSSKGNSSNNNDNTNNNNNKTVDENDHQLDDQLLLEKNISKSGLIDTESSMSEELLNNPKVTRLQHKIDTLEKDYNTAISKLRIYKSDLEREEEKNLKLEGILQAKNDELRDGVLALLEEGKWSSVNSLVDAESRIRSLEIDNAKLRHDFESAKHNLSNTVQENTELIRQFKEMTRELLTAKNIIHQANQSKRDAENMMSKVVDEKQVLIDKLHQTESDMNSTIISIKEQLSNCENERMKTQREYTEAIDIMKEDISVLMTEITAAKSLAETKTSAVEQTANILEATKLEVEDLTRKLELVTDENIGSRNELEKILLELDIKSKECANLKEDVKQAKLEKEKAFSDKYALIRNVERLAEELESMKSDITESGRRLGDARQSVIKTEKLYENSQTMVVSLQADLRFSNAQYQAAEDEKKSLILKLNQLNESNKILGKDNQNLKQQITLEQSQKKEERKKFSDLKSELTFINSSHDKLKTEMETLQASLDKERNLHMSLREQFLLEEKQQVHLQDRIKNYELEISCYKQKFMEERVRNEQYKNDHQQLLDEVRELHVKLENQEEMLLNEQAKYKQTIDNIKSDFVSDLSHAHNEKEVVKEGTAKLREELQDIRDQLSAKELQLRSCYQSIGQLNSEAKGRKELECQLMQAETELREVSSVVNQSKIDLQEEIEKQKQLTEQNDKLQLIIQQLKEGLKVVKEQYTKEVFFLSTQLQQISSNSELEIQQLRNDLNQRSSELKAAEASLLAVQEAKESIQISHKNFERTIDALKRRLHQEMSSRKLCEQRMESLKTIKQQEAQRRTIDNFQVEKESPKETQQLTDQVIILQKELNSMRTSNYAQEAHVQTLELQLAELQSENFSLKKKQDIIGRNTSSIVDGKLIEDMKKQLQLYSNERAIFFQSAQKLAQDLETCRSQANEKLAENSKLRDELNSLKERLREMERLYKIAEESARLEIEEKEHFQSRNQQLELMNIRLKTTTNLNDS
ncbi:DgyrCDS1209 [Dimorphilus gyrociliatus]|uniref:DgyrCDS1209 n=1 Tax=Dimorphilus gyrociliatus TaxID=2664684 RepID=A0A7I8V6K2_9ANNE|nr:DgyrCDS1209 [Dimorphilus gyrociliatus]